MDNSKKLTRSKDNRMIAGVCGGLAEYFSIDPTIVRLIYALFTLFTVGFAGVIAYVVMCFVVPEKK